MKLSQLTTEQLADVLVRLTPPLCRILRDEATLAALDNLSFTALDAQPPLCAASRLWEKLIPVILQHHAELLRQQSGLTTITDLISVWDGELTAFFTSAGSAAQERS